MLLFLCLPKTCLEMCMCINKNMNKLRTGSEEWIESASKWDRGLLVTLNLWHHYQTRKDENNLFNIRKKITLFRERLEGKVFKDKNKHIEIFPVIHRKTLSNHIHILLNTPQHIKRKQYIAKIKETIKETNGISKAPDKYKDGKLRKGIQIMYDKHGAVSYVQKELTHTNSFDNIDSENIFLELVRQ